MNIAATTAIGSGLSPADTQPLAGVGGASGSAPFSNLLQDTVASVNRLQDEAHAAATGLMTGSGVDVHQAMIAAEKASIAFELALALRNKAVQAYQQVMSMQF